jgi:hypothetical protein
VPGRARARAHRSASRADWRGVRDSQGPAHRQAPHGGAVVLPGPPRAGRLRSWARPERGAAPAHRSADLHVAGGRRDLPPRQPGLRADHSARPGEPHDRWARHHALGRRRDPGRWAHPRRSAVDRAARLRAPPRAQLSSLPHAAAGGERRLRGHRAGGPRAGGASTGRGVLAAGGGGLQRRGTRRAERAPGSRLRARSHGHERRGGGGGRAPRARDAAVSGPRPGHRGPAL